LAVEVSGGDVDALETTIGLLSDLRIIQETDEGIRFVNFNKRNYEKPSASPEKVKERVRKHREKHAQAESNTPETPLPDDVTPCNALDTDTDTEIDKDNIIVPTAVETIKPGGQEFEGKKTATKQYAFDDEHLELAQKLLDCILEHKPNFKAPKTLDQWANTMRLMIEQDKRRPAVIASIIAWSQKDQFWQNNILSADTLRKQFDRLEGQQSKAVKVLPDKQAQPKSQSAVQQAREMFYARGGRV
ncbi:hypothetical protein, partial [Anaerospora hongkongensis]|uniref:hypothetical protein n=1 Tax=Anaerospora hongkongensis TaxID=244830 RepID=UPI003A521707